MTRFKLDVDALAVVDAFSTTAAAAWQPRPHTGDESACCEAVYIMAPITAHTDPCDVCCQQQ